jgi:hypothetical protein
MGRRSQLCFVGVQASAGLRRGILVDTQQALRLRLSQSTRIVRCHDGWRNAVQRDGCDRDERDVDRMYRGLSGPYAHGMLPDYRYRWAITFLFATMDINKQLAALTTSELQTAGASQATAIAVSVLLRHLQSPELSKRLSSAFENHQAVMLQTPWPDQMLQSFEATRRFIEGAAKPPSADDAPRSAD